MNREEDIVKQIESGTLDYRKELMDFMDIMENVLKYMNNIETQVKSLEAYLKEVSGMLHVLGSDGTPITLLECVEQLQSSISKQYKKKYVYGGGEGL